MENFELCFKEIFKDFSIIIIKVTMVCINFNFNFQKHYYRNQNILH